MGDAMKISATMERGPWATHAGESVRPGFNVTLTVELPDDPSSSARESAIRTVAMAAERLWEKGTEIP